MADQPAHFVWFELMTFDVATAKAFYADVVGWRAVEWRRPGASAPDLDYTVFTAQDAPVAGLIALPEDARKMGATPRWAGYLGVGDIDTAADRIAGRGGIVYVPPTDSNIGRIAIIADPQTASLALVEGLKVTAAQATGSGPGRIGWHELYATDHATALPFYAELFGWRKTVGEIDQSDSYQLFAADGPAIGGILTKRPLIPSPFWLHYFNVDDLDAAMTRVTRGGGRVFARPNQTPAGDWAVHCADPQGAVFALQGGRSRDAIARDPAEEVGWSSKWGGFSSQGKVVSRRK